MGTLVWAGGMSVSPPDWGGLKIERPSSDRVLDAADAHSEAGCFRGSVTQGGTGSYCTGVEGRVLDLLRVMPP